MEGGLNFFIHSKFNRVFINHIWSNIIPKFGILFESHSLSDHMPIYVKFNEINDYNARIPFRYSNSWYMYPEYYNIVQEAFNTDCIGNPLFILFLKIKKAKSILRAWHNSKPNINKLCDQLRVEANNVYSQIITPPDNNVLIGQYNNINQHLHNLLRKVATDNIQTRKINWLKKGIKQLDFFMEK